MREFLLHKTWKNDILKCIQEAGLTPLSFEWSEEPTETPGQGYLVSVLRHSETEAYFKFDRDSTAAFSCKFSPGGYRLVDITESITSWDNVLAEVKKWVSNLKEELVPDLWEQLKQYAPDETFMGKAEISNAPFSYSEAENIFASLDRFQSQVEENFNLQGEQLAFVKRQIDYLKDAAKRQGRKDWIHTFIGVIVTIATDLALSPEKAKILWDLVRSRFSAVLPLPAP